MKQPLVVVVARAIRICYFFTLSHALFCAVGFHGIVFGFLLFEWKRLNFKFTQFIACGLRGLPCPPPCWVQYGVCKKEKGAVLIYFTRAFLHAYVMRKGGDLRFGSLFFFFSLWKVEIIVLGVFIFYCVCQRQAVGLLLYFKSGVLCVRNSWKGIECLPFERWMFCVFHILQWDCKR